MGCGMVLPSQDPHPADMPRATCPRCGAVGRQKSFACNIAATASLTANAQLIIGWQEVDRLLDKAEYGAALLVAAINVQFIRSVARVPAPTEARHGEKPAASGALVREITDVRNKIAHERGYFALLTQLRDPSWPEARIRQVLKTAKEFCHGNAP
jgi:hypothetical protein